MKRPPLGYAWGAAGLLDAYLAVVSVLRSQRDFSDAGPVSFQQLGRSADDREASRVLSRNCRKAEDGLPLREKERGS